MTAPKPSEERLIADTVRHNARTYEESTDLAARPWRQGRKVGRNVYAQISTDPSDDDVAIGSFDSEWLAFACVQAHNAEVVYHPEQSDGRDVAE
jgi:hypothetical protein